MANLSVFDLYNQSNSKQLDSFSDALDSSIETTIDYNKVEADYTWLEMMENTIRYIDNILRNPNRFIINEEDIVKVELARRVTVESIKHLSRNTNLIQDIDKKTGDVKPSKILNINKEESFNTYENRFIYSLIQNMKMYINLKKNTLVTNDNYKNNKTITYSGNSKVNGEKVNLSLNLETKLEKKGNNKDILARIERLELNIADLTNSEVYQSIHKLHISLVTSPIKKTNVILKNVNFQYAVKLWDYIQNNTKDTTKHEKKKETVKENEMLKSYIDETFYLNYLISKSLDEKEGQTETKKAEINEKIVDNMLQKLAYVNSDLNEEQLKDMIDKQFVVFKNKYMASYTEIERIFKDAINKYIDRIENFKF